MSKFQECLSTYDAEFKKLGISYDADLLAAVAKGCGPSIYNADASKIASSDQAELDRVKKNFLMKKLGLGEGDGLDEAINDIVQKFGTSNRNKYRAMFYYLLVKKYGKEGLYK